MIPKIIEVRLGTFPVALRADKGSAEMSGEMSSHEARHSMPETTRSHRTCPILLLVHESSVPEHVESLLVAVGTVMKDEVVSSSNRC